jgi:class 3 adenylate cyclase
MDYTIVGNEVNLAARLQTHADLGSILMSHETYSLVKDIVLSEEQEPIHAKGFAKPVRASSRASTGRAATSPARASSPRRSRGKDWSCCAS